MRNNFEEIVRNLDGLTIQRIQVGAETAAERRESPKLEAACAAWEEAEKMGIAPAKNGGSMGHRR